MRVCTTFLCVSLSLAGCQSIPLRQTPYGFARGGALTDEEYARLEPFVRSQVWTARLPSNSDPGVPTARYVYSFVPGFDPRTIRRLEVQPFQGKAGEAAKIAVRLPHKLAETLAERGLPAFVASNGFSEEFAISGTVTRADPATITPNALATQIEARVTQDNKSVGAIQINFVYSEQSEAIIGPPAIMIGKLIARALEPNLVEMASTLLSNPFKQVARTGAREGISAGVSVVLGMLTKETGYGRSSDEAGALDVGQPRPTCLTCFSLR